MDDKLKATLEKVVLLAKNNNEFDSDLRKALNMSTSISDQQINHIQKYLGLDYFTDTKDSIIDYSYITIPEIKDILISDNREMMRHRYGTRYHKTDFHEFCRYAHLQVEMLINYYFDIVNNSDFNKIVNHIKEFNPKAKINDIKSFSEIPFTTKLWAFCKENKIDSGIFLHIKTARNNISHRAYSDDTFNVFEYQNTLINANFKLNKDGEVTWIDWKNKSMEAITKTEDFKKYKYIIWVQTTPFDSIIESIKNISDKIFNKISKI
ncbi:MAG: hypothetical protein IJ352_09660 [Muribaculaceae bacterium]|nr:hypothetical protein [Muribaculaceae bacterium]